ncbi:MAG: carbohydrate ABC transporter permease [Alphaproteobacteria bacterium]
MSSEFSAKTYNKIPLWGRIMAWLTILIYSFLTIGPLFWLFMSSVKPHREIARDIMAWPKNPTFSNFERAWRLGEFAPLFFNSVLYAAITTMVTVFLAISTAYAFSFIRSRLTKFFYGFILVGLLITVHSTLIPLYLFEVFLNIDNTRIGILIPYIAFALPFAIYLGVTFIKDIPAELFEAARMDGANHRQILFKIVFPIAVPIAVTIAIFTFLGAWNEFVLVYTLTSDNALQTLPVGINKLSGGKTPDRGLQFASLVITTLPMILFYALFQKQLHKGFAGGSVKG